MGTEKRVDYAAAYRQFLTYGNSRSLKEFCDTEDYDYNRLRRYATKSFWSQQMSHSNTTPETASVIPLKVDSERGNTKSEVQQGIVPESPIKVNDVNVHLSNGLELRLHEGNVEALFEVLHKILA